MAKTIEELRETAPIIEVDDYAAGFMMASDVASCYPELKAQYLARWAARLREHYVKIGIRMEEDRTGNIHNRVD